jgi:very-short-patch-repair endonuclease
LVCPYSWDDIESVGKEFPKPPFYMLYGQQQILQFRVDFVVARYNPVTRFFRRFIIECDGREFHSSIEQQKRDKERDRQLKPFADAILRFSGSELHRDAANQAWNILWGLTAGDGERLAWPKARPRHEDPEALRRGRVELGLEP